MPDDFARLARDAEIRGRMVYQLEQNTASILALTVTLEKMRNELGTVRRLVAVLQVKAAGISAFVGLLAAAVMEAVIRKFSN